MMTPAKILRVWNAISAWELAVVIRDAGGSNCVPWIDQRSARVREAMELLARQQREERFGRLTWTGRERRAV